MCTGMNAFGRNRNYDQCIKLSVTVMTKLFCSSNWCMKYCGTIQLCLDSSVT